MPAAVTAWRYSASATSPAAKTPSMLVVLWRVLQLDVARVVEFQAAVSQELRRGGVPDGDEQALDGQLAPLAGLGVLRARHAELVLALVAEAVHDDLVPEHLDVGLARNRSCMTLLALSSSRRWMIVDLGGELGQVGGLLHGRVAAADDGQLLVAEDRQGPVAHGAGETPPPVWARRSSFSRPSQLAVAPVAMITAWARPVARPRGVQRVNGRGRFGEVAAFDVLADDLRPEALGLLLELAPSSPARRCPRGSRGSSRHRW
jgi:hypothetical protein